MIRVGCVLAVREGLVLAVRRPDGRWALPGGYVDVGESVEQGARRELLEETGYRARYLTALVTDGRARRKTVTAFAADSVHGTLRSSDEGLAAWVPAGWLIEPTTGAFADFCRQVYAGAMQLERHRHQMAR